MSPAGSGSVRMKTSKWCLLGCLVVGMICLSACGGYNDYGGTTVQTYGSVHYGGFGGYGPWGGWGGPGYMGGGGVIIGGPIVLPDEPIAVPMGGGWDY